MVYSMGSVSVHYHAFNNFIELHVRPLITGTRNQVTMISFENLIFILGMGAKDTDLFIDI